MRGWNTATARVMQNLAEEARCPPGRVSFETLEVVPHPAARYLLTVLRDGQPLVRTVRARQAGELRTHESADPSGGWRPFEATQFYSVEPPGFVWDGSISVAPCASMRVRDTYVGGLAFMLGARLGLTPEAAAADDATLRAGALQRFLAESVWFPTALLPGERLRWSPVDGTRSRATLADGGTVVTLEFEFAPTGEILGCCTPRRPRAVPGHPGRYEVLPWGARYSRYEERGGMVIPRSAEMYWVIQGREQPYYRGTIARLEYDV